jgi:Tol biopolymer transport system component
VTTFLSSFSPLSSWPPLTITLGAATLLGVAPVANPVNTGRLAAPAPAARAAFSEPSLSPDRREIAFVAGGDIWTVPASGGEARLLVTHPAYDSRPLYSPDGTRLAFMSTRTGNGDIYVLTLATGALQRVTFDDAPDQLDAWSRDGKWLYLTTNAKDVNGSTDIYRVAANGGTPMPVSADVYANEYWAAPSPADPNTIALTGKGDVNSQWWRHGHAHIDESQIWLEHFGGAEPTYEAVTHDEARDEWPMWSGDAKTLYYVSDLSGQENVWAHPLGGKAHAVTSYTSGRVIWPTISYDGEAIVFERSFGIYLLDVASGKVNQVAIALRGVSAASVPQHLTLTQGFQWLTLSPDGKKIAFTAHGDVFAASAKDGGNAERVTHTPELEANLAWAPDSRRLVYVSERDNGVAHLYLYDFGTQTETRLTDGPKADIAPTWSPDGKTIAFMRGAKELRVLDVATRQDRLLATGELDRPPRFPDRPIAWSPDGRWIGYLAGQGAFQNPYIVSLEGGEARPAAYLPNGFGASLAWSPDGTYLLFDTSQRTEQAQVARVDLVPRTPRFREEQFRDLFNQPTRPGIPAEPSTPRIAPPRGDSTAAAEAPRGGRGSERGSERAERKPTQIVFDGIRDRLTMLPVGVDARSVEISPDGKTALLTASAAGQANLYVYSLDELSNQPAVARQLTSTPGGKSRAQFAANGKEVYFLQNGRINVINVDTRQEHAVNVTAELDVDFDQEKVATFHQAWNILANNFFDATMNGVDWKAVGDEFAPYAAGAQNEEDLRRIGRLMIGELNSSHSGMNGPSYSPQVTTGRLGVRFERAAYDRDGSLKISEVLPLSPAELAGVKVGDVVESIDGAAVTPRTNLDSLLNYTISREVALVVGRGADHPRLSVRPVNLATERGLGYRAWVESRRAYVDKISGGKLGYVHMPDMSAAALEGLYLSLDTQNRSKEGVVIDIRNNNGGFVNPYAIDVLSRRGYLQFTPRDFVTAPGRTVVGQRSLEKPTVLVTNMRSLSDAEDFTEGYRALKIGPTVGEPTAGWIIFTSDVGLLDGASTVRMPFERITDANGKPMELHPRPVDVLVERPIGESYTGRDSQLDAAVAALLERVGAAGGGAGR